MAEPTKINPYDELVAEARGAGVDPRSVEYFQGLRQTAAERQAAYTRTLKKKKSGLGGFVRKVGGLFGVGGSSIEKYRTLATEAQLAVKDAEGQLRSDITKQIELQKIRRAKKSAVQEQVAGSLFKRGKTALLSSTAGGGGFFTGYFDNA